MNFADLASDEDVLEVGKSEATIYWMRTNTCKETSNVEVWVARKRESLCLLILEKEKIKLDEEWAGDPQSQLLRIRLQLFLVTSQGNSKENTH